MDEKLKARIRSIKKSDKSPGLTPVKDIYQLLARGKQVYIVFESNAHRTKYQQRIVVEASEFMDDEPMNGIPRGSLAGQKSFVWKNGAELALGTDMPGDPNGKLFAEIKPAGVEFVRPLIPSNWM